MHINLTKNQVAIIDIADSDLAEYSWQAVKTKVDGAFYACRKFGFPVRKTVYLHQIILERIIGRPLNKKERVDHVNGNRLDNRRANLRLSTSIGNGINRKRQKNNTSGYMGVCASSIDNNIYWFSYIMFNKKHISLGTFPYTEQGKQEAAIERDRAAIFFHGNYATLNFPSQKEIRLLEITNNKYKWMSNYKKIE